MSSEKRKKRRYRRFLMSFQELENSVLVEAASTDTKSIFFRGNLKYPFITAY